MTTVLDKPGRLIALHLGPDFGFSAPELARHTADYAAFLLAAMRLRALSSGRSH
jgi:hypothetical protein